MTMTQSECANLLICCGALHDIAEKSVERYTGKQATEVREKIEKIAAKYLPLELRINLKK